MHYPKLVDRKLDLLQQFAKYGIEAEWVEQFDRATLTEEDKAKFIKWDDANKAIVLSFWWCFQEIIDKYDLALILEDDATLEVDFVNRLNDYISQLPEDWDLLFIGNGCYWHISPERMQPYVNVYRKEHYANATEPWGGCSRSTDAVVVNKKCAKAMVDYMNNNLPVHLPCDQYVAHIGRELNFNAYWGEPTLVSQGTQVGKWPISH